MDDVQCKRIVVRGLTAESHGNATGIGIAEFTTEACVAAIDRRKTNVNSITGNHPEAGMIPLVYPTDADAISAGLSTIGMVTPAEAKVIQIGDTLHLSECLISESYLSACDQASHLEIVAPAEPMKFDSEGRLRDVYE